MSIEKKKVTLNMNHVPCTFHKHLVKLNRFRDRFLYVSMFGHKQHFRKKCPYCINALQQHAESSLLPLINPSNQQNQEQSLQIPEENNYFEGKDIHDHPLSFPYPETMVFDRIEPSYLRIFAMNEKNHETLKLHYEFGRELFFSQGPLDFVSVSLVVSVVCDYLKCDLAARIFLSFGCVSSLDQNNKDAKFCSELRKLVEDILLRQKPTKSQYFSKQLLAFTYFLVQHVWQVCVLCMAVDLKENKQQLTEKKKVSECAIITSSEEDNKIQQKTENEPEQECTQMNSIDESQSPSKQLQVCQCNSLIQKGIWRAERRDWDQIPMKLLLSSELLTLLNLRYQQLNKYHEDLSISQTQLSEGHPDKETLIAYISCILQVKDSTFDFRRIHNLPLSIRNLVKVILKQPVNLSDSLFPEKYEDNTKSEQYLQSLLLITESSIFIGFTIFAKQIEW